LGKSEGKQESEPKRSRRPKTNDVRSGPQEDRSRSTCQMGQSESGKEGGVDHWAWTQRSDLYAFRTTDVLRVGAEALALKGHSLMALTKV